MPKFIGTITRDDASDFKLVEGCDVKIRGTKDLTGVTLVDTDLLLLDDVSVSSGDADGTEDSTGKIALSQVKTYIAAPTTAEAHAYVEANALALTAALTTNSTIDSRDVATDGTKLDGIEASADVTDTTNVTSSGALMDSEVTNLAEVKAFDASDYATSAQGTLATNALPKAGGIISGTLDIDNVLAVGNQSNINTNQGISFDHDQTFTAAGSSLTVACLSTLNNNASSAQNTYTSLGFFPGVTTAADVTQITAIYGKLNIQNPGGYTIDQASHIRLRPQPTAATVNAQLYMEGDSDIYCEGDTTFKNKLVSVGTNWTHARTGKLWTTSSTHGLVLGDIVQATTDGGGAARYNTGTNYYVTSVPTTTTLMLSDLLGGGAIDGTDSSGNWAFSKQNQTKIDGYDLQTSHHSSVYKMHMIISSFDYTESAGTLVYIPLNGSVSDSTTIGGKHCFIAPYSGYVDKVIARSESVCGSTVIGWDNSTTGTTFPSGGSRQTVTVNMATDDTPYVFEFKSERTYTFNEGEVITFSFDPANVADDVMITVVLKLNITDPLD
tara:strand:- start:16155 stop:17813 length:1659 start_codon:yes stop_codon:yes gene_type:complete